MANAGVLDERAALLPQLIAVAQQALQGTLALDANSCGRRGRMQRGSHILGQARFVEQEPPALLVRAFRWPAKPDHHGTVPHGAIFVVCIREELPQET